MKTMFIILGAIAVVYLTIIVVHYHRTIAKGKCPVCGCKLEPFANDNVSGRYCPECGWWEGVDNYGNEVP